MSDVRPVNCRFRLQEENKAYPRSNCEACGKTIMTGLGPKCERPVTPLPETGVDAPIDVSEAELQAATDAIVREYGRVIGRPQARNIAYISLVAARCAWFAAKEPTA